jgi:protein subunit release factor B/energy-coupling factor transporter ATP-binding protein EcfA2
MNNPNRPMGVFLFLGPTGVGKTELVKALANVLYGDPSRIARFNLSDFQSDRAVFNFFGYPYSDSEEQRRGQLSNRLRQQLFTVLLLDEFEKGHPAIAPRLLQLFDEGILVDGDGDQVNLRNTIIVLTSNLGAGAIDHRIGFSPRKSMDAIEHDVLKVSEETFRPEFINRLDAVCFFKPLSRQVIRQIARREAQAVIERDGVRRHRLRVSIDESVIDALSERGYDPRFGARYLSRQVERNITYPLARQIARRRVEPGSTVRLILRNGEIIVSVVGAESIGEESAAATASETRLSARERRSRLETARSKLAAIAESMDIADMRERISAMMVRVGEPDFWARSAEATARLDALNTQSQILDQYDALVREVDELSTDRPARGGPGAGDDALPALEREIFWLELSLQLREPVDRASAFLTVKPISGTDAPDVEWTRELAGMYMAWAAGRGFGVTVLNETGLSGEPGASPIEVTLAIAGHGAYALLKGETGTHRLQRPAGRDPAIRLTVLARVDARPDLPAPRDPNLKVSARPIREISAIGERLNREVTLTQADDGISMRLRGRAADEEIEELARRYFHARRATADASPLPAPDDGLIVARDLVRSYSRFKGQMVKDARTGQLSHRLARVLGGELTEFLMARLSQGSVG